MVAVAGSQAVQLEVDRFSLAIALLLAAAQAHWGHPATLSAPTPPNVLGSDPPDTVKAKFEKAVRAKVPLVLSSVVHVVASCQQHDQYVSRCRLTSEQC